MQISCPSCKTRINVPDDKIKPEGTKVKCGKCAKIFTVKKKVAEPEAQPKAAAPAPAPKPVPAPEAAPNLDSLFDEPDAPPPAEREPEPVASAGESTDDNPFGGDNFGADMNNFQTQVRPVGNSRDTSMFGSSDQLDDEAIGIKRDDNAAGLFDRGAPDEPAAPSAKRPDDDLEDLFGPAEPAAEPAAKAAPKTEPRAKSKAVMPPKESIDDLFGNGLDDDTQDNFVNQLAESKTAAKAVAKAAPADDGLDDLFGQPDEAPKKSAAKSVDSLFDRHEEPVAKPKPPPAAPAPKGPSAEDLASTLKLEPALKEEESKPLAPPKPAEAKAPTKKRAFPVRAVVLGMLGLMAAGGVGAVMFVPSLNKTVMGLLPMDKVKGLLKKKPKVVKVEEIFFTATVQSGRALLGGRGDHLYVLEGVVRNDYQTPRSFIKLRGELLGAEGALLATREIFAGNVLNDEELRGLERIKIDGILNRQVGGGLQNFNVPAGSSIPFQIVFYDVEAAVQTTRVQPIASEPGN